MAARKDQQTKLTSQLARTRVAKGVTRPELAEAVGISLASLRRLEQERAFNAPFWWYRNCAIALQVDLDEILDERELRWRPAGRARRPPGPEWLKRE